MREYKFRGKDLKGEWRYGFLFYDYDCTDKYSPFINWKDEKYLGGIGEEEVEEETLGQFTGLKDKNSKEIYEGDVLQIDIDRAYVKWNDKYGYFQLIPIGDYYFDSDVIGEALEYLEGEIIGNIYDNKELLGGQVV